MDNEKAPDDGINVHNAALVSMGIMLLWILFQLKPSPSVGILFALFVLMVLHALYPLIVYFYCRKEEKSRKTTGIVILVLYWMVFIPYMIIAPSQVGSDALDGLIYVFGSFFADVVIAVLAGIYFLIRYIVWVCRNWGKYEE